MLNLASGMYFGLNTVGTRTWQLIQELGTLEAVRRALVTEFDVDDATAGRDLTALVAELAARTLVQVE